MSALAVPAGLVAGTLLGLVLQRGGLCFHSLFVSTARGDTRLLRGWLLGVGIGAVGLALVYALPVGDGLNHGLAFRPVRNIGGGLLVGLGMAVGRTCASGLFYKLGTGMLGALAGIAGWIAGEYAASRFSYGGPTVLPGGDAGTIPGVLGLPRLLVAVVVLAGAVAVCLRLAHGGRTQPAGASAYDDTQPRTGWAWPRLGIALGFALVAGWLLARVGDASFGPSTVGATASVAGGAPMWWLVAFLVGLVGGGLLGARAGHEVRVRGERPARSLTLALGGVLLGAGGWIAGGCNLGHGLSGAAQLNVGSWAAVAAMAVGSVAGRHLLDRFAPLAG